MERRNKTLAEIDHISKLPPQSPELEEAVLGAVMLEKNALNSIIDLLKPEHFYVEENKLIYEAIISLGTTNRPVDMLTVVNEMKRLGTAEKVSNAALLVSRLTSNVSSAANIQYHAAIIRQNALKRDIITLAGELQRAGFDESIDAFDLLKKGIGDLMKIDETINGVSHSMSIGEGLQELAIQINARKDNPDAITGIKSGYAKLDHITQGWQNGNLIILAGRPGMAKTTLAINVARNAAVDFQVPVAIFSLEMTALELVGKLASAESSVESRIIRSGQFQEVDWVRFVNTTAQLAPAPLYIDDTPAISILELHARARRLKKEKKIGLLIVDYLQLMRGDGNSKGNREQEIASISRGLKLIAKELNIPVIALSQLSRGVESRGGEKRPQLSDLRESGAIEQDADIVIFLYRPEYYKITTDEEGRAYCPGYTEIIFAKHRGGGIGDTYLQALLGISKFREISAEDRFLRIENANSAAMDSVGKLKRLHTDLKADMAPNEPPF